MKGIKKRNHGSLNDYRFLKLHFKRRNEKCFNGSQEKVYVWITHIITTINNIGIKTWIEW